MSNERSEPKPHIERDYDDQSIMYRIADLLEEAVAELRSIKESFNDG